MRRLALCATVALVACRHPAPPARPHPDVAGRLAVARAEQARDGGVDELARLAESTQPAVRAAALRGLGRVGGTRALGLLRDRVRGDHDAVAAAEALGVAGALDSVEPDDAKAITGDLIGLAGRVSGDARATVIEALGRVGDASALPTLAAAMSGADAPSAAAAGIAIGRFGRRSIALDDATIAAVIARASDPDREVRYAATFALTRAPGGGDDAARALAARVSDSDAEIRATALTGLAKRKARTIGRDAADGALADADWRVQVEAVRFLGGDGATADDLHGLATVAAREWVRLAGGDAPPGTVHVVDEALAALAGATGDDEVRAAIDGIASSPRGKDLASAHVHALALAALASGPDAPHLSAAQAFAALDGLHDLPEGVTGALVAQVLLARGEVAQLVDRAVHATDAHRRAAALEVLGDGFAKADDADGTALIEAVVAALGSDDTEVAGSALDAADPLITAIEALPNLSMRYGPVQLERAVVARLDRTRDPELESDLLTLAGKAHFSSAEADCKRAFADPSPAVRAAARTCLTALDGKDPGPGAAGAAPPVPPVDPATVIGKRIVWTVETSRGTLTIALDPDLAPWHVAAIVALTRKHFYDGLPFHRVVPDFVVQGGDPDGTGWGGPGFTLPSEPSSARYARGAIGIADAGKDTGGSQWFVTHVHTPHLEGRYTVIGAVTGGDAAIDALLVGDRIVHATVSVEDE